MDENCIEYKLACLGFFGKPINTISDEMLNESMSSGVGEIITEDEIEKMKINATIEGIETYNGDVESIKENPRYFLRLNTNGWKDYILKGNFKKAISIFVIASVIFNHKEGITKDELRKESNVSSKRFVESLNRLSSKELIYFNGEKYFYGNGKGGVGPDGSSDGSKKRIIEDREYSNLSESRENEFSSKKLKDDNLSEKFLKIKKKCRDYIENSNSVIEFKDLVKYIEISEEELKSVLKDLEREAKFQIYTTTDNENIRMIPAYLSLEKRKTIISEILEDQEAIMLSEWKSFFRGIYTELFMKSKNVILNFFEEMGFKILEITSKNTSSEIIIYKSTLSKDSEKFKNVYKKSVLNIGFLFREKITRVFFKNVKFSIYDNLYHPDLRNRMMAFRKFIKMQMENNSERFLFDRNALMEMDFISFATCVPLYYINFIPELINQIFNKNIDQNYLDNETDNKNLNSDTNESDNYRETRRKHLEIINNYINKNVYEDYDQVMDICINFLNGLTIKDIFDRLDKNTQIYIYLDSRAHIKEFMDNFVALINSNYFKLFENTDYIFFELIEKANGFLDKSPKNAFRFAINDLTVPIDFKIRKHIYENIIDFNPDEFIYKAREFIKNENINEEIKRFFLKKIKSFR